MLHTLLLKKRAIEKHGYLADVTHQESVESLAVKLHNILCLEGNSTPQFYVNHDELVRPLKELFRIGDNIGAVKFISKADDSNLAKPIVKFCLQTRSEALSLALFKNKPLAHLIPTRELQTLGDCFNYNNSPIVMTIAEDPVFRKYLSSYTLTRWANHNPALRAFIIKNISILLSTDPKHFHNFLIKGDEEINVAAVLEMLGNEKILPVGSILLAFGKVFDDQPFLVETLSSRQISRLIDTFPALVKYVMTVIPYHFWQTAEVMSTYIAAEIVKEPCILRLMPPGQVAQIAMAHKDHMNFLLGSMISLMKNEDGQTNPNWINQTIIELLQTENSIRGYLFCHPEFIDCCIKTKVEAFGAAEIMKLAHQESILAMELLLNPNALSALSLPTAKPCFEFELSTDNYYLSRLCLQYSFANSQYLSAGYFVKACQFLDNLEISERLFYQASDEYVNLVIQAACDLQMAELLKERIASICQGSSTISLTLLKSKMWMIFWQNDYKKACFDFDLTSEQYIEVAHYYAMVSEPKDPKLAKQYLKKAYEMKDLRSCLGICFLYYENDYAKTRKWLERARPLIGTEPMQVTCEKIYQYYLEKGCKEESDELFVLQQEAAAAYQETREASDVSHGYLHANLDGQTAYLLDDLELTLSELDNQFDAFSIDEARSLSPPPFLLNEVAEEGHPTELQQASDADYQSGLLDVKTLGRKF